MNMLLDPVNDPPTNLPNTVEAWYLWLSSILSFVNDGSEYKQDKATGLADGMSPVAEAYPFFAADNTKRFFCSFRPIVASDFDSNSYGNSWEAVQESVTVGQPIPNNYRRPST